MTRKQINPREASVAATFYVPVYQRLRQWHQGRALDLICFVDDPGEKVKRLLGDFGAAPNKSFRARCFAEVWEIPHRTLLTGSFANEPAEFDKRVTEALGSHDGKFSAEAGLMHWDDHREEESNRRHVQSLLLSEANTNRGKSR